MDDSQWDYLLLGAAQRSLQHAMVDLDEAIDLVRRQDNPDAADDLLQRLTRVLNQIAAALEQNGTPPSSAA
jgi:type VI protein secretion system component VasF